MLMCLNDGNGRKKPSHVDIYVLKLLQGQLEIISPITPLRTSQISQLILTGEEGVKHCLQASLRLAQCLGFSN